MTDEHTETPETVETAAPTPAAAGDAPSVEVAHHDDATHMDEHTTIRDDDHGHTEVALGPIDYGKWAFAIAGGAAALVMLAFFVFTLGGIPA